MATGPHVETISIDEDNGRDDAQEDSFAGQTAANDAWAAHKHFGDSIDLTTQDDESRYKASASAAAEGEFPSVLTFNEDYDNVMFEATVQGEGYPFDAVAELLMKHPSHWFCRWVLRWTVLCVCDQLLSLCCSLLCLLCLVLRMLCAELCCAVLFSAAVRSAMLRFAAPCDSHRCATASVNSSSYMSQLSIQVVACSAMSWTFRTVMY